MEEATFRAVVLCQMLGSTTRFRILKLLARRRMTPGELCRALKKSSSIISVQLAKLRNAGLVRFKREADGLLYWLKPAGLGQLIARLERYASGLG